MSVKECSWVLVLASGKSVLVNVRQSSECKGLFVCLSAFFECWGLSFNNTKNILGILTIPFVTKMTFS